MTTGATADQLLDAEDLAKRWKVPGKKPTQGIYRMVREGVIPAGAVVKLGRYVRFYLPKIEEFEQQGGVLGKEAA